MSGTPSGGAAPRPILSVSDGTLLLIGMVVGVGIFKSPAVVAANTAGTGAFLAAWLAGGLVSFCGALVYAELAARLPETGGEYAYLTHGWGRGVAFLFAWSRMCVIQTGAIAAVAFVFGDYAAQIWPLGGRGPALYAALSVAALTLLNLAGTRSSKTLQKVAQTALVAALVLFALFALAQGGGATRGAPPGGGGSFGLAMIFVLLAFGGWNEAAYLAGEVRNAQRDMARILTAGIVLVTALYLLVNAGYVAVLGMDGLRASPVAAADAARRIAGERGALAVSLLVCAAALTTMNAAIFTGARSSYALGRDFGALARLGLWRDAGSTPANALFVQGAITLLLVLGGAVTPDGFSAMVTYTAPVFWAFFLLTGLSLFRLRARAADAAAPSPAFLTPLYPVVPLAFCAACAYMLYSSIEHVRTAGLNGVFGAVSLLVMAAGIPLYRYARGTARDGDRDVR